MRMKHEEKVKLARKLLTPEEQKKRGKKQGFILFESKAYVARREAIADRVARKNSKKTI